MPPSHCRPLPPRSGRLLVAKASPEETPPLSDVKQTMVLSSRPSSSEFLQHDPDRSIHRLDHARIDRAVLNLSHAKSAVKEKTLVGQPRGDGLVAIFFP